jgi:transcriptional regulator with XRE-family HTH domain
LADNKAKQRRQRGAITLLESIVSVVLVASSILCTAVITSRTQSQNSLADRTGIEARYVDKLLEKASSIPWANLGFAVADAPTAHEGLNPVIVSGPDPDLRPDADVTLDILREATGDIAKGEDYKAHVAVLWLNPVDGYPVDTYSTSTGGIKVVVATLSWELNGVKQETSGYIIRSSTVGEAVPEGLNVP